MWSGYGLVELIVGLELEWGEQWVRGFWAADADDDSQLEEEEAQDTHKGGWDY